MFLSAPIPETLDYLREFPELNNIAQEVVKEYYDLTHDLLRNSNDYMTQKEIQLKKRSRFYEIRCKDCNIKYVGQMKCLIQGA